MPKSSNHLYKYTFGGFGGFGVSPDFARVFGLPPFHQNHQLTYIKKGQVVLVVLVV
jgi:hypothetical protein